MRKPQVFIVVSQLRNLVKGSRTEWQVQETVEFVDRLKDRYYSNAVAIANYTTKTIIKGQHKGIVDYDKFEDYIRNLYPEQMAELDKFYRTQPAVNNTPLIVDGDKVVIE